MQHLPPEFIVYVENYWQEYRHLSKLIAKHHPIDVYSRLDDLLKHHIENIAPINVEEDLKHIINECSQLLKEVNTRKYKLLLETLETLETEYFAFVESYGVDFNDRTYDEEFYAFIHGINNN